MPISRVWIRVLLIVVAVIAASGPALLFAAPTPAQRDRVSPATGATATLAAPTRARAADPSRQLHEDELQNMALSLATGFAGGFTVFLFTGGMAMFRAGGARTTDGVALAFSMVASVSGFLMGMTAFVRIIMY